MHPFSPNIHGSVTPPCGFTGNPATNHGLLINWRNMHSKLAMNNEVFHQPVQYLISIVKHVIVWIIFFAKKTTWTFDKMLPSGNLFGSYGSHGTFSWTISLLHLLGGLVAIFWIFPYIGNVIIPTDFPIFQRGGPTTKQFYTWRFSTVSTVEFSQRVSSSADSIHDRLSKWGRTLRVTMWEDRHFCNCMN